MRKFKSHRGETLAEVLVALLIVTLATLMLAAMATASNSISITARQKDEEFYQALRDVEAMKSDNVVGGATPEKFTVNITLEGDTTPTDTADVNVYVSEDGELAAYKEATP